MPFGLEKHQRGGSGSLQALFVGRGSPVRSSVSLQLSRVVKVRLSAGGVHKLADLDAPERTLGGNETGLQVAIRRCYPRLKKTNGVSLRKAEATPIARHRPAVVKGIQRRTSTIENFLLPHQLQGSQAAIRDESKRSHKPRRIRRGTLEVLLRRQH